MTNTPVHPKEPDVLRLMGATRVGDLVQGGVTSVPAGARLSEAAQMLDAHRISALLVLEKDRPVGR